MLLRNFILIMDVLAFNFANGLLLMGLFFPVVSWVTLPLAWWTSRKTGRHCSAVMIPVIGPICLTLWLLVAKHSVWLIPLVWILDPATALFLWVFLWKVPCDWIHERRTCIARFQGKRGRHAVKLSLYEDGSYTLEHDWRLSLRELGVTSSREIGHFSKLGDEFELVSPDKPVRILRGTADKDFELIEKVEATRIEICPLNGFLLQPLLSWKLRNTEMKKQDER